MLVAGRLGLAALPEVGVAGAAAGAAACVGAGEAWVAATFAAGAGA